MTQGTRSACKSGPKTLAKVPKDMGEKNGSRRDGLILLVFRSRKYFAVGTLKLHLKESSG